MKKAAPTSRLVSLSWDILALFFLALVGWFLMGHIATYSYFDTGFEDFMSHAFRVDEIQRNGVSSWSFSWANGLSYWRSYQYVPHVLTVGVKQLFNVPTVQAMLISIVLVVYISCLSSYLLLRRLGINRMAALLSLIVLFTVSAVWETTKVFSLHFSLLFLPIVLYCWINDVKKNSHSIRMPFIAGISWFIHPILGYTSTFLWIFSFSPQLSVQNIKLFTTRLFIYLLPFSGFLIPFVTGGYSYENPLFSTSYFVSINTEGAYFGLGTIMTAGFIMAWVISIVMSRKVPRWTKILLAFVVFSLLTIMFAKAGLVPSLILKLQIGRMVPLLSLCIVFCLASSLNALMPIRSRFLLSIPIAAMAFFIVEAASIISTSTGGLRMNKVSPIAEFFNTRDLPKGSVLFDNVSEGSFFTEGKIRFVGSYFTHLDPQPSAQRFALLTANSLSYSGVSKRQTDILSDYARVYGVEYMFLPRFSPLVSNLVASDSGKARFTLTETDTETGKLAVLHSTYAPAYAYAVPDRTLLRFDTLDKPGLNVMTWKPWDDTVTALARLIDEGTLRPLPLSFDAGDTFHIDTRSLTATDAGVLVTLSHDELWSIADSNLRIEPTSLRHMFIPTTTPVGETLTIQHNWPDWHWPLQIGAMSLAGVGIVLDSIRRVPMRSTEREEAHTPNS